MYKYSVTSKSHTLNIYLNKSTEVLALVLVLLKDLNTSPSLCAGSPLSPGTTSLRLCCPLLQIAITYTLL